MAIPTDISLNVLEAADTVIVKCRDLIPIVDLASNKHDEIITSTICNTVLYVSLFVCIAVVFCFLAGMLFKGYSKKKEYELEILRVEKKDELWQLQKKLDMSELNMSKKLTEWEIEKDKAIWKLVKDKEVLELRKNEDIRDIQKEVEIEERVKKALEEYRNGESCSLDS